MADKTEHPLGRWVTMAEACAFFGRSERTMRRRLKTGSPRSKRAGGRVYVWINTIDDDTPAAESAMADMPAPMADMPAPMADMSATVAELEAKLAEMSAMLSATESDRDRLQELGDQIASERDYLRQALAAALSKIPELPATTEPTESERPARPWWQFWK